MKFLVNFCGIRALSVLSLASLLMIVLDLMSIAVVLPFLTLFMNPSLAHSNKIVSNIYRWIGFDGENEFLLACGVVLIIAFIVKLVAKTLINMIKYRVVNNTAHKLATGIFSELMGAEYALFTEQSTAEMVVVINSHSIHSIICLEAFINGLSELIFLLLFVGFFFVLNPIISAVTICIFAAIGVISYFTIARRINETGNIHSYYCNQVHRFGFVMANSIKDVKIMGLEKQYSNRFEDLWQAYSGNMARSATIKAIPRDFSEFLVLGALVSTCLFIASSGYSLTKIIPLLGLLAISIMRALPSLNRIISSYNEYKYYRSSLGMVEKLYHEAVVRKQKMTPVDIPFESELSVTDLVFSYNGKMVLDKVSFSIEKGQAVAFVGASGTGKSTLLDVLAGLRELQEGSFLFDGVNFNPFTTDALKRKVGYVPQSVTLADESVAFNIAFTHEYDKGKMLMVLRMAQLNSFIDELPDGINTLLGESGVRVSGGQRQRIGIARALYRDPEILIFDEATSAVDTVTERELMREINSLSGEKTLIIVAHRLSTVEKCTAIHLLENGRIIARGTQDELLQSSPQYRNLYQQQEQLS